ncbi:MAG: RNA-binding S4 domain-containing protein [bacterium]|nr:MAG: RNA-binding S4 domain-containing protein [bacterium]
MRSSKTDRGPSECVRLDLFLKRSRLIKRRSLAATVCKNGYVRLNGRVAQPGRSVRVGDRLEVRYPSRKILVEITAVPAQPRKGMECYRVLSVEDLGEDPI